MLDIWNNIYHEIEKALHEIGSVITADVKQEIIDQNIRDKGDFYRNATYLVSGNLDMGMRAQFGSNVAHEPYVLGGKEPSWTPFEPILGWVQRKGLSWLDKKGKPLSEKAMAWMIINKIKRDGIPARNVFAEVLKDRKRYVLRRLKRIGK